MLIKFIKSFACGLRGRSTLRPYKLRYSRTHCDASLLLNTAMLTRRMAKGLGVGALVRTLPGEGKERMFEHVSASF